MGSMKRFQHSAEQGRFRAAAGSALGNARVAGSEHAQMTRYRWQDPETGECLEVELWSSEDFRAELESVGFTPLAWENDAPRGGCTGGRNRVRPSAPSNDVRTGPTPPAA